MPGFTSGIQYDKMKKIEYRNERIEAQRPSVPPVQGSKAVAGGKGAAAEGGNLQPPPGQAENIRLTVAFLRSAMD